MRDLFAVANLPVLHVPMIPRLKNLAPTSGIGQLLNERTNTARHEQNGKRASKFIFRTDTW